MAGDVFISYRRTRDSVAQRLEESLRENGFAEYQIFRDVRGLFPGEDFEHQLTDTLRRTRIVLLLLGPGDAPRPDPADWLSQELRAALKARRPVLPILLKGADKELQSWPAEFDQVLINQSLRLSQPEKSDDVKRLVAVLRRFRVRPRGTLEQWSSLLTFNPTREVEGDLLALTRAPESRVVLLHGESGTGRTHVMNQLAAAVTKTGVDVGLHHALDHRLGGVDCAAAYDWVAGVLVRRGSAGDDVVRLAKGGLQPSNLPRSVIDRLDAEQRRELGACRVAVDGAQGKATVAASVLMGLAERNPLVLLLDDLDLADAGSQELVLLLARALQGNEPPDIHLVLAAAENPLLDLFFRGLDPPPAKVPLQPAVDTMLTTSGLVDAALIAKLLARQPTPSQCVGYLRHLHDQGLIEQDPDGMWRLGDPATELPPFPDVLDAELESILPPGLQQLLEIGSLCGPRFAFPVVEKVALSDAVADETSQRLLDYDPQNLIISRSACAGEDRLRFASSMWWKHLNSRRTDSAGAPIDADDARRLAVALSEYAVTSNEQFDDWSTVGFLFDSIDDYAQSGAAFLRAARAARLTGANEAAARGYEEAARRLELHAVMDTTGLVRVGELLRSAYCLYRAATVLEHREDPERCTQLLDRAEGLLDTVRTLFADIGPQRDQEPDFDEMITHGAVVSSETSERLRLQWRSLRGFVALERGRRTLTGDGADGGHPEMHFYRALHSGEAGLSGSVYRELVVASCAGLALVLSRDARSATCEAASAAWIHGARAMMLSRVGEHPTISLNGGRDRYSDAEAWVRESRRRLAELARPGPVPDTTTEDGLVAGLASAYRLVTTDERRDHPSHIVELGRDLLTRAADVKAFRDHSSFERDLEIYAFAHDLFRFAGSESLLRMWRDLRELAATDTSTTEDVEWHNPVVLHGKIGARWLELDIGAREVIGSTRFARLCLALETHTVGAVDLSPGADSTFVRMVHLADLAAGSRVDEDAEVAELWRQAFEPGGLEPAYHGAFRLKGERLVTRGRFVSEQTKRFAV